LVWFLQKGLRKGFKGELVVNEYLRGWVIRLWAEDGIVYRIFGYGLCVIKGCGMWGYAGTEIWGLGWMVK
jgi:hypothetical protein